MSYAIFDYIQTPYDQLPHEVKSELVRFYMDNFEKVDLVTDEILGPMSIEDLQNLLQTVQGMHGSIGDYPHVDALK